VNSPPPAELEFSLTKTTIKLASTTNARATPNHRDRERTGIAAGETGSAARFRLSLGGLISALPTWLAAGNDVVKTAVRSLDP